MFTRRRRARQHRSLPRKTTPGQWSKIHHSWALESREARSVTFGLPLPRELCSVPVAVEKQTSFRCVHGRAVLPPGHDAVLKLRGVHQLADEEPPADREDDEE